jgi:hypothetical protein
MGLTTENPVCVCFAARIIIKSSQNISGMEGFDRSRTWQGTGGLQAGRLF